MDMTKDISQLISKLSPTELVDRQLRRPEVKAKIEQIRAQMNYRVDPWGMDPEWAARVYALSLYLYEDYFRVETRGIENIPQGRCMLISNHSGQIPIDGLLIGVSTVRELDPPRVVRGMVERLAAKVPFVNTLFARTGMVTGDPTNCENLLERGQPIMVFPEGVKGSGKTVKKAYQLQKFGTGFLRIAIRTKTPIVPVSVVGIEEAYPSFSDAKAIAKLFGLPYIPITPFFPLLGPLGIIPIPAKVRIFYGTPLEFFDADPNASDEKLQPLVEQVKESISQNIARGLTERKSIIGG